MFWDTLAVMLGPGDLQGATKQQNLLYSPDVDIRLSAATRTLTVEDVIVRAFQIFHPFQT